MLAKEFRLSDAAEIYDRRGAVGAEMSGLPYRMTSVSGVIPIWFYTVALCWNGRWQHYYAFMNRVLPLTANTK